MKFQTQCKKRKERRIRKRSVWGFPKWKCIGGGGGGVRNGMKGKGRWEAGEVGGGLEGGR